MLARAEGPGNVAVLLGSATGRDGIGGASVLASAGFSDGDVKRPSVQVGDPFEEKRLIEACLELLDRKLAVGVQDLGAAGLSCAASETAAKGGVGMDVDLARVARREPGMNGVEVMTSESQERMLAIVEPAQLDAVLDLARKWEIRATVVGRVTDTDRFRVFDGTFDAFGVPGENPAPPHGDTAPEVSSDRAPVADVPVGSLGDGPLYHRPAARPQEQDALQADDPAPRLRAKFPIGADLSDELLALLATPTIADKTWVSRQYDHQLFLSTVAGPGADAAVLRVKGTTKALALATDGKARFCHLDPRVGARLVVLEAARNVACSGARPLALVNCLNFGDPGAPRGDVAVHRGRRGDERGVRSARHPGHRRQRVVLQRVAGRRHPSDAGGRRARVDRRAARGRCPGVACGGRVDRRAGRHAAPSSAGRSGPQSCTGSRRNAAGRRPRRGRAAAPARRRARASSARWPACTT